MVTVLVAVLAFWGIKEGKIGYMPPIEDLQNPINRYATQVYSADGKIMGTWSSDRGNRVMVDYNNLPQTLVQALVATEDVRFYDHSGIDFYALGRAIVKRGIMGQSRLVAARPSRSSWPSSSSRKNRRTQPWNVYSRSR